MKVLEVIDRGGCGRVEKVQLNSDEIVARKVFDPTPELQASDSDDKLRRRFVREVKTQSQLSPDNFVPVLDSNLAGDELWYTSHFVVRISS